LKVKCVGLFSFRFNQISALALVLVHLLRERLDAALPAQEQDVIALVLSEHRTQGIQFHALRTRVADSRRFVSLHVLVPGAWTVQRGHDLCEVIELAISAALPGTHVTTHLEPLEDPISWDDQELDRSDNRRQ